MNERIGAPSRAAHALVGVTAAWLAITALPAHAASDELTLYTDGTFLDTSRYDTGETSTDQGFYTSSNGSLDFESSETGLRYQGSVTNNVLTEVVNGYTQVFEKQ